MRLGILIIPLLFTIALLPMSLVATDKLIVESKCNNLSQLDDDPILIENNTGFALLGFPGNGTSSDPYIIENQRIQAVDIIGRYGGFLGIDISYTDAFFIIRNCVVEMPYRSGYGIRFYNVTNAIIENCNITISETSHPALSYVYGIYASRISNVHARNCIINGGTYGIEFTNGQECSIEYSRFINQIEDGIEAVWLNDTEVHGNTIVGLESGQTYTGIMVAANVWNCSLYSNSISHVMLSGIRLHRIFESHVSGNNVTDSRHGILIQYTNETLVQNNILTNSDYGLYVDYYSYNNTLSQNILGNNEVNAKDQGDDNDWISNWYSDYGGNGAYFISGAAKSFDLTPQPTALHIPLFMMKLMIWSLVSLVPLGAAVGYIMNYRKQVDDSTTQKSALLIMVLSVLLPCGLSATPLPDPTLPNLRFILVDVIFAAGASRTPGTDWTVDYYSSSIITGNDMMLLVSLPYLVGALLSIIYLMGYLRREISERLLRLGMYTIIVVTMIVPLLASVFLVPLTPLLALSIVGWGNMMKIDGKDATSS